MKKIILLPMLFTFLSCFTQMDCENFKTFTASYILVKSIAGGIDFYTESGFTAQIGAAFTYPQKYKIETRNYTNDSLSNYFDLFAGVGWRLFRVDYVVSIFGNVGYTIGNAEKLAPFTSLKILFPLNNKAISVEPLYIFGRGVTAKVSAHFKI